MADVLDDFDSRPGSATSLLRTIIGAVFREFDGWLPTSVIVTAMCDLGVPEGQARTALTRVKAKGLLTAERRDGRPGYRLEDAALPMLQRGDRRIHEPRVMSDEGDRWCLIAFSIPETQRDARHQLRRRLSWIGAGTVTSALWVTPGFLRDEVVDIVQSLGLQTHVTLFTADEAFVGGAPSAALVAQWWDLDSIRDLHDGFLRRHATVLASVGADGLTPREAFTTWIRALDTWHPIPYLDPGLPPGLLPSDWPGNRSVPLFLALRDATAPLASAYIAGLIGDAA